MKKHILYLLVALFSFSFTNAHAQGAAKKKAAPTQQATGKTKKDGTPDMRYKENKDAAKPATKHLKKDGTPDKRYSENKK